MLTDQTKEELRKLFQQFQSAEASSKSIVGKRNMAKVKDPKLIESTYELEINAALR